MFLLSRIRERYQETGDSDGAVAHGVATTSRLITGAALIIIAVFWGFAMGDLIMFQQMGFGSPSPCHRRHHRARRARAGRHEAARQMKLVPPRLATGFRMRMWRAAGERSTRSAGGPLELLGTVTGRLGVVGVEEHELVVLDAPRGNAWKGVG